MTEIILFAGGIGSGKAYQMNKIVTKLKETGNFITMISFADPIKKMVKELYGVDKNGVILKNVQETDVFVGMNNILNKINNYAHVTEEFRDEIFNAPFITEYEITHVNLFGAIKSNKIEVIKSATRKMMQIIGTEIGQKVKKTIWPNHGFGIIKDLSTDFYVDYAIVDDLRFLFEFIYGQIKLPEFKITPYYIEASKETRAKRRNISIEQLELESQHFSERESLEVLLPYMKLHYPENIINGENE